MIVKTTPSSVAVKIVARGASPSRSIEERLAAELDAALGRARHEAPGVSATRLPRGRPARVMAIGNVAFWALALPTATTVRVPRARLATPGGKTKEWRNATFPACQRRTKRADALIAGAYLSGTNTRRARRALAALFGGAVGKDTVSPGLAQDQVRLGRLERALAQGGADHPTDP